ncbi:hypothetical protein BJ138DRAFT_535852 [Hygrophoropsis aurantiaca]|uniref:Uncharacterized protein n=1 Tax=Hygrophoropsis aurantiaca TaxID=72124 RepID=A0ACB8A0S5_9AGAM|nr:hypothetical protein BJ138DRAFT_535852 [Hygrophoropsis aurantiaca]
MSILIIFITIIVTILLVTSNDRKQATRGLRHVHPNPSRAEKMPHFSYLALRLPPETNRHLILLLRGQPHHVDLAHTVLTVLFQGGERSDGFTCKLQHAERMKIFNLFRGL